MLAGNASRESLQGWSGDRAATAGLSGDGQSPKEGSCRQGWEEGLPSQRAATPTKKGSPARNTAPPGADPARTPPGPGPPTAPALLSPQSSG